MSLFELLVLFKKQKVYDEFLSLFFGDAETLAGSLIDQPGYF